MKKQTKNETKTKQKNEQKTKQIQIQGNDTNENTKSESKFNSKSISIDDKMVPSNLDNCSIEFLGCPNVYEIKKCFEKLYAICVNRKSLQSSTWYSKLESTNWLNHLQTFLIAANTIAETLTGIKYTSKAKDAISDNMKPALQKNNNKNNNNSNNNDNQLGMNERVCMCMYIHVCVYV